jgi:hypothetical protein
MQQEGINVIELANYGVEQKYLKNTTFDNIFGDEWNKTRYQTVSFKFETDSRNNVEFQCQFYPNYDDAFSRCYQTDE